MGFSALPLFTDAYFGDTKHLDCEQHGAYLQLLMIAWRSPGCAIPDDDAKIARMISLPLKRWLSIKPTVMAFWTLAEGVWIQPRLAKEHEYVTARVEKRREAGKLGGRPKSLENQESTKAKGSSEETIPKAPSPSPTLTEERDPRPAREAPGSIPISADWQPSRETWAFVVERCGSEEAARAELERFRLVNEAKGTLFANIDSAFRAFVTSPFAPRNRPAPARDAPRRAPTVHDAARALEAWAKEADREEASHAGMLSVIRR